MSNFTDFIGGGAGTISDTDVLVASSTTYTAAVAEYVYVHCFGGGGSGGLTTNSSHTVSQIARGGGSGAYSKSIWLLAAGDALTLTVGAGGAGISVAGNSATNTTGNAGGTTTAALAGKTTITAPGGPGGTTIAIDTTVTNQVVNGPAMTAAIASGGDTNIDGALPGSATMVQTWASSHVNIATGGAGVDLSNKGSAAVRGGDVDNRGTSDFIASGGGGCYYHGGDWDNASGAAAASEATGGAGTAADAAEQLDSVGSRSAGAGLPYVSTAIYLPAGAGSTGLISGSADAAGDGAGGGGVVGTSGGAGGNFGGGGGCASSVAGIFSFGGAGAGGIGGGGGGCVPDSVTHASSTNSSGAGGDGFIILQREVVI